MTHVITEACIDCIHKECVKECPVDCIYEGVRALYIQPDECIDCGACVPACPEDAIFYDEDVPDNLREYIVDNKRFFTEVLAGKSSPLGSPGAAAPIASYGADTELVSKFPIKTSECKET